MCVGGGRRGGGGKGPGHGGWGVGVEGDHWLSSVLATRPRRQQRCMVPHQVACFASKLPPAPGARKLDEFLIHSLLPTRTIKNEPTGCSLSSLRGGRGLGGEEGGGRGEGGGE